MESTATALLQKAMRELDAERARIDRQRAAIREVLNGFGGGQRTGKRRRLSAAQRRAISKRVTAQWATWRKTHARRKG